MTTKFSAKREFLTEQRQVKKTIVLEAEGSSEDETQIQKMKGEMVQMDIFDEEWNPDKESEFHGDEEDEEFDIKMPKTKSKKRYKQQYTTKYEADPIFKDWIKASSRGDSYAYCVPCSTHLKVSSGRTDLVKHSQMRKHKTNLKEAQESNNCITAVVLGEEKPIAKVELSALEDKKGTKRKRHHQKYSSCIENDPWFRGWIKASPKGDFFAHCIPCDVELKITAGKVDLRRHALNKKHINAKAEYERKGLKPRLSENFITNGLPEEDFSIEDVDMHMNAVQIKTSMDELEDIQKSPMTLEINSIPKNTIKKEREDSDWLITRVQDAELNIAAFITKHDFSLEMSSHLMQLIKRICPDSSVAQNLQCDGIDMMLLINNVLGKERFEEVLQLLRDNKFSLIVDESAARDSEKYLILVAKVLHNHSIIDAFLGLIPISTTSHLADTVDKLHRNVVEFFNKNSVPYKENMIGLAVEGGNTTLGTQHSLACLMKIEIPNLFIMKCIPHSFSVCASNACLRLPQALEDLVRDIYSYFKFTHHEDGFETFISTKPYKLLHPQQTRWLSSHVVVSIMLKSYESLKTFFSDAASKDQLEAGDAIFQRMNVPVTKLYLMFLDFVLPIFENLDKHMQSESTQIHVLHNAVGKALTAIYECYLTDTYLRSTPLKNINYKDETNFKPIDKVYLGIKINMEIANVTLPQEDLRDFRMNCLEFLIESVSQIYKRFSYGCPVFESLEKLNPKVVIERDVPSLIDLVCHFEHLATPDTQVVDSEWRLLRNLIDTLPLNSFMKPEVFWNTVSKAREIDNVLICPNLSQFMLKLLCLPSSTAVIDKAISAVNKMKNKSKHSSAEAILGVMHTNQVIRYKS